MKKRLLAVGIAIIMGTGLIVPKVLSVARDRPPKPAEGHSEYAVPPLKVNGFRIVPSPLSEVVAATGSLTADESVQLQAEIAGKIASIHFTEGSRVRKGDLLLKINDADLQAAMERVVARRKLAEIREKRVAMLLKDGGANRHEFDTAVSEREVQNAETKLIQAQLDKTEIRAPFDGVVGLRHVSEGAYVAAATLISTLQRTDPIKVDFPIPEKYAMRVSVGSRFEFEVSGSGVVHEGTVYAIETGIDVATRTLLVRGTCENSGGLLRPGAFARVRLAVAEVPDAILVPSEAVVPGLEEQSVFVVSEGRAHLRLVRTGIRTGRFVQIVSGLKAGEVVATTGLQQLRDGRHVDLTVLN